MKRSPIRHAMVVLREHFIIKSPKVRRTLTKLIYGSGKREVRLAGGIYQVDAIRENGYLRASRLSARSQFLSRELDVLNICSMLAAEADIFIDVGANIGTVAGSVARSAHLCAKTLKVIAIEAHPDTYERLSQNGSSIGFECHNLALSDQRGELTFVDGAVSHVFTTVENASRYNIASEKITVKAATLEEIAPPTGLIAMKIDVEGQEAKVLRGGWKLLESGRVRSIYFDGLKDKSILDELRALNYRCTDTVSGAPASAESFGITAVRQDR